MPKIITPIINRFYKNLNYLRGFTTNRKILVIESDDWGSIRMPSKEVYNYCLKSGYPVDKNPYERYDSLASEDDLSLLFDLLTSKRNYAGNSPIITANSLVGNPNFKKIEKNNYESYYFESIKDTFDSYPRHSDCLNLWHEGDERNIFHIQYHGREHLNVHEFIKSLRKGDVDAHFAFMNKMPGSISKSGGGNKYVMATKYTNEIEKHDILGYLIEGIQIFEEIHKKKSKSFIAPNYRWNPEYNEALSEEGIEVLQGDYIQKVPKYGVKEKYIYHYTGETTKFGQVYLVRNCSFEPFSGQKKDPVNSCLSQISKSFSFNKPAIISSHRVNYVGFIDEDNRDKNLKLFNILLDKIITIWPDVEFLSSDELGDLIRNKN